MTQMPLTFQDSVVQQSHSNNAETAIKINEEIINKSVVHKNLGQDIIITTSDKIKLILGEFQDNVKANSDWVTPFGILVTIIATLVTTDFKKFINIEGSIWKALYIFSGLLCFFYCIKNASKAIKNKNKRDIDYVINKLALKDDSK